LIFFVNLSLNLRFQSAWGEKPMFEPLVLAMSPHCWMTKVGRIMCPMSNASYRTASWSGPPVARAMNAHIPFTSDMTLRWSWWTRWCFFGDEVEGDGRRLLLSETIYLLFYSCYEFWVAEVLHRNDVSGSSMAGLTST